MLPERRFYPFDTCKASNLAAIPSPHPPVIFLEKERFPPSRRLYPGDIPYASYNPTLSPSLLEPQTQPGSLFFLRQTHSSLTGADTHLTSPIQPPALLSALTPRLPCPLASRNLSQALFF